MEASGQRQGSFLRTAVYSFIYGFAGLLLPTRCFHLDTAFLHDGVCLYVIAPIGAFAGFVIASIAHEFAHFFAARAVGGFVRKVEIGSGALLFKFLLWGTPWEIHESLRSGLVYHFITTEKKARLKLATITAAGPIVSLALVAAMVAVLVFLNPFTSVPHSSPYYLFAFLCGFTAPCLLFLPGILIPFSYRRGERTIKTDALNLLTIPWLSNEEIIFKAGVGQKVASGAQIPIRSTPPR